MLLEFRQGKELILLSKEALSTVMHRWVNFRQASRDTEVLNGRNSLRKYIKARKHSQCCEIKEYGKSPVFVK